MRTRTTRRLGVSILEIFCVVTAVGCGADGAVAKVIEVAPGSSIQEAVDRASSGDVVLVQPGTYHETIVIDRAGITLRGVEAEWRKASA